MKLFSSFIYNVISSSSGSHCVPILNFWFPEFTQYQMGGIPRIALQLQKHIHDRNQRKVVELFEEMYQWNCSFTPIQDNVLHLARMLSRASSQHVDLLRKSLHVQGIKSGIDWKTFLKDRSTEVSLVQSGIISKQVQELLDNVDESNFSGECEKLNDSAGYRLLLDKLIERTAPIPKLLQFASAMSRNGITPNLDVYCAILETIRAADDWKNCLIFWDGLEGEIKYHPQIMLLIARTLNQSGNYKKTISLFSDPSKLGEPGLDNGLLGQLMIAFANIKDAERCLLYSDLITEDILDNVSVEIARCIGAINKDTIQGIQKLAQVTGVNEHTMLARIFPGYLAHGDFVSSEYILDVLNQTQPPNTERELLLIHARLARGLNGSILERIRHLSNNLGENPKPYLSLVLESCVEHQDADFTRTVMRLARQLKVYITPEHIQSLGQPDNKILQIISDEPVYGANIAWANSASLSSIRNRH